MQIPDRYEILERLGKQRKRKFGDVFLGRDKTKQTLVALKTLRKDASNSIAQNRLRKEADFSFTEHGLPCILDFYEGDDEIILVKEYVEGITIDLFWKQLAKRKRIAFIRSFLNKLIPIFESLESNDVVHCDIKPENILIHGTLDAFEIALIDFGLAVDKQNREKRSTLFPLGFAAPELLLNQLEIISQKSDIYALGILFWRLFAERLPLTHPNPSIFTNLQLTHPIPAHDQVPKKVFEIIARMTVKHSFKIPPNRMKKDEVIPLLQSAMEQRLTMESVANDFSALKTKRFWF